ncbi:MAG: SH3 domain-containing protein [Microcoleaceae cyanobacterium]
MKRVFKCVGVVAYAAMSVATFPGLSATAAPNTIDPYCRTSFRLVDTEEGELNLRDQPSAPDAPGKIIGEIPRGTEVMMNVADRSGDWAEVTLPGGKTGWVAARYLKYSHHGSTEFTRTLRVRTLDGDPVNFRSTDFQTVIDTVPDGSVVEFIRTAGYYSEVQTSDGQIGAIDNRFLICN